MSLEAELVAYLQQEAQFRYFPQLSLHPLRYPLFACSSFSNKMHDEWKLLQVVVCSFVYGSSKAKDKTVVSPKGGQNSALQPGEKSATPVSAASSQNLTPNSSSGVWLGSRPDMRNLNSEIDLTRG